MAPQMPDRWTRELFLERFVPKVEFGEHWIWTAAKVGPYGQLLWRWERLAHRLSYACFNGPLLPKHEIHHACPFKLCVHPDHLVQCTLGEHHDFHVRRGTYCQKGLHVMDDENIMTNSTSGLSQCRACHNKATAAYRRRRRDTN